MQWQTRPLIRCVAILVIHSHTVVILQVASNLIARGIDAVRYMLRVDRIVYSSTPDKS